MFSKIIDFIVAVYTYPVQTWRGGCSDGSEPVGGGLFGPYCEAGFYQQPDRVLGAGIGLIIYVITALVIFLIAVRARDEFQWRRNREHCQHCDEWTVELGNGDNPGCLDGQACCDECYERHIDEAVERRAETEPRIDCPHCAQLMDKAIEHRIILDVCVCGAVFLSPQELEHLEALASEMGYDNGFKDGRSVGSTNGMLVGLMIGNSFD